MKEAQRGPWQIHWKNNSLLSHPFQDFSCTLGHHVCFPGIHGLLYDSLIYNEKGHRISRSRCWWVTGGQSAYWGTHKLTVCRAVTMRNTPAWKAHAHTSVFEALSARANVWHWEAYSASDRFSPEISTHRATNITAKKSGHLHEWQYHQPTPPWIHRTMLLTSQTNICKCIQKHITCYNKKFNTNFYNREGLERAKCLFYVYIQIQIYPPDSNKMLSAGLSVLKRKTSKIQTHL